MAHTLSAPKPVGGISLKIKSGRMVREETIEWFLTADNINPNKNEFLSIPGFPIPNSTSSSFAGVCTAVSVDRIVGNRFMWSVKATFSSDIQENSGGDGGGDPEAWVPVREVTLEPFDVFRTKDLDLKPFTNGAGVPFDSAPPTTNDLVKWDFFQFEPITGPNAVTDTGLSARNMVINTNPFVGCAADTLLLRIRKSSVGYFYGARRRLTEYSMTYNPNTWHEELPNVGNSFRVNGKMYPYRYYVEANGKIDTRASEVIHTGPLGNRDVPLNTNFVNNTADPAEGSTSPASSMGDDGPSGGVIKKEGKIYAVAPPVGTLFFIKRRVYTRLPFASFLRVT